MARCAGGSPRHDVDEQLETMGILRLVGFCVIELRGESGTCCSGRSIDDLVVSKNFRQCVKNVCVDKRAPWSAHVATAFDAASRQTFRLVVITSPLIPQAPSLCREKWLARHRAAEHAVCNNWWQACSGRWVTPLSCPACFPSGRWPLNATSTQSLSWTVLRGAGGQWPREPPDLPLATCSPEASR